MEKYDRSFIDTQGRRKELGDGDGPRHKNVANDHEGIDRELCAKKEPFLPSIKWTMAQCVGRGFVLKISAKCYDFKDTKTSKNMGSVKGSMCGKYASFGTCLQQWLWLSIMEDLMRQVQNKSTSPLGTSADPPSTPEEVRKAEIRDQNDRAIALIAEA